ncbi:MAG: hypothetical protein M0Z60_12340 [Nitrospiraceae bacterium]|nr:hypothetical protein [Nitrospiraceae bacterium]
MTNAEWLSWFFYGKQFWMAPVRIAVNLVAASGAIILGTAERKIKYILFGIALFAFEMETIHSYRPDLKGFFQFDLLAARLFYGFIIVFIPILLVVTFKIDAKRRVITGNDKAIEKKM